MATVRDVVTSAYRRLGLLAIGEDLPAERAPVGLDLFNALLASFQAEGSTRAAPGSLTTGSFSGAFIGDNFGQTSVAESGVAMDLSPPYGLDDAFPMAEMFRRGVTAVLACELAPEAGLEATATLQNQAKRALKQIMAVYVVAPNAQQDSALTWMPSLRRYGFR